MSVETVIIVANRLSAWCIRLMIGGNKGWGRDGGVVGCSLVSCRAGWLALRLGCRAMRKQPPPSKGKWLIVSFSLFQSVSAPVKPSLELAVTYVRPWFVSLCWPRVFGGERGLSCCTVPCTRLHFIQSGSRLWIVIRTLHAVFPCTSTNKIRDWSQFRRGDRCSGKCSCSSVVDGDHWSVCQMCHRVWFVAQTFTLLIY